MEFRGLGLLAPLVLLQSSITEHRIIRPLVIGIFVVSSTFFSLVAQGQSAIGSVQEYSSFIEFQSELGNRDLHENLINRSYEIPSFKSNTIEYIQIIEQIGTKQSPDEENPSAETALLQEFPNFSKFPPSDTQQLPPGLFPILDSKVKLVEFPGFEPALLEKGECNKALENYSPYQDKMVENPRINELVDQLVKHCYDTSTNLDGPIERARFSTVLIGRGDRTHCTGYLIDAKHVLTAAHCFAPTPNQSELKNSIQTISCIGYWIKTSAHEPVLRKISGFSAHSSDLEKADCPRKALSFAIGVPNEDIVIASLDRPVPNIQPYAPPSDAVALTSATPLLILGRRPNVNRVKDGTPNILPLYSGACRLTADVVSENGRIIHQCLTVNAMSGAPIFSMSKSGQPVLIGVHQRALIGPGIRKCPDNLGWCKKHQESGFANVGHIVNL